MKCKMCEKRTDWDSSVGRPNFIICNNCVEELHDCCNIKRTDIVNIILTIGFKREVRKNDR